MFDIILLTIGLLLCILGIIGSFIPIIPGPLTSWTGILLINLTESIKFNIQFVLITFIVALIVSILDYLIPMLGVKKLGGSKGGLIGASFGLIIGIIIIGPVGLLLGSFIGAITGEMLSKKTFFESIKPALGSIMGVLIGSGIKFCLSMAYLFFFLNILWSYKENFF